MQPFRLAAGDLGPVQQSPVTCGSACLTVARMLVDPLFARFIDTGEPHLPGSPEGANASERFAAYERVVMARTNALSLRGGRLNPPWPHRLGTPPWGARAELELGASRLGTRYSVEVLRPDSTRSLRSGYDRLVDVVADGEPGLLYVGNALLPRHVVLILPGDGDRIVDVYDPATGRVRVLRRDEVVQRRIGIAGWDVPWIAVQPTGERRVRSRAVAPGAAPNPA